MGLWIQFSNPLDLTKFSWLLPWPGGVSFKISDVSETVAVVYGFILCIEAWGSYTLF